MARATSSSARQFSDFAGRKTLADSQGGSAHRLKAEGESAIEVYVNALRVARLELQSANDTPVFACMHSHPRLLPTEVALCKCWRTGVADALEY